MLSTPETLQMSPGSMPSQCKFEPPGKSYWALDTKASYGNGLFVLKPGAFCSMPPGVRHEVSNPSKTNEAFFLLVHASMKQESVTQQNSALVDGRLCGRECCNTTRQ